MTIGIYRLVFEGTDKCYIGQSITIEKRYLQHVYTLKSGIHNFKLQEAYHSFGKPSLEVLLECKSTELDEYEDEAILIFNSVDVGLNIYKYANQAPVKSGVESGNSKYTKEFLLEVLEYVASDSINSILDIANSYGIASDTILGIIHGENHVWVSEEFPELYAKLVSRDTVGISKAVVSSKLSAKSRGIVYPSIMAPEGTVHTIDNAYAFAKSRGLAPNHFQEVLNGKRKSHKGWRLA